MRVAVHIISVLHNPIPFSDSVHFQKMPLSLSKPELTEVNVNYTGKRPPAAANHCDLKEEWEDLDDQEDWSRQWDRALYDWAAALAKRHCKEVSAL